MDWNSRSGLGSITGFARRLSSAVFYSEVQPTQAKLRQVAGSLEEEATLAAP